MMKKPYISAVIGAYTLDRMRDIDDLLNGFKKQEYKNYEIVFISDCNSELLVEVKKLAKKLRINNIRFFLNKKKGLSNVKNLGIQKAKGEIVAFIDDDAVPFPKWTKAIKEGFQKSADVGAVTGTLLPEWIEGEKKWFPEELYWMIGCSYSLHPKKKCFVRNGFGGNLAFNKKVFKKIGLFNPELGYDLGSNKKIQVDGEEADICIKLHNVAKKRVFFNPTMKIYHKVYLSRLKLKTLLRRAYGQGYSKAIIKRTNTNENLSTENSYIKHLVTKFYPKTVLMLFYRPIRALRRLVVVSLVTGTIMAGYFVSSLRK